MIKGIVSESGSVVAGQGFALERTGPGVYTILLLEPASDAPVVLVTPTEPSRSAAAIGTAAGAEIMLTDHNGTFVDGGFSFAVLA